MHQQNPIKVLLLLDIRVTIVTQLSLIVAHPHYLLKNIVMFYILLST
jgi:hypothetical protein